MISTAAIQKYTDVSMCFFSPFPDIRFSLHIKINPATAATAITPAKLYSRICSESFAHIIGSIISSATENIRINVLVKTPLGTYVPVTSNNKFVPSVEGEYTVIYYALDESGNTAKLSYTVKVGGGNNQ